jgi:long-chain acyl-CoA synthetase
MPLILESTITRTLLSRRDATPDAIAFSERVDSRWIDHTTTKIVDEILGLALVLHDRGLSAGERVAIVGNASVDFVRLQWAVIACGAVPVPLSPVQSDDELAAIFRDAGTRLLCLETQAIRDRLSHHPSNVLEDMSVLTFGELPELLERGRGMLATGGREAAEKRLWDADGQALFLLVYTSGTTGEPKGSMISQAQLMSGLHDCAELFRSHLQTEQESTYTVLPLANIFGQFELAIGFVFGWKTCFSSRVDRIESEIAEVQPSLLFGVPKLFEKILSGIQDNIDAKPAAERMIIEKLIEATQRVAASREAHERPSFADTAESMLARQTVIKGIQKRLGGRLKFAISGGAPLPPALARDLDLLGVRVLEGYGLTETCGPIAINDPEHPTFGSVGHPLPSIEIQILSDREIVVRSKESFLGYWNRPETTTEIVRDGWLHTGDLGYLDTEGRLHITDRKKDLIILSSGRTIAPQKIESRARSSKYLEDFVVLGDRRSHVAALITLRRDEIIKFCTERQILFSRFPELVNHPKIRALVQSEVEEINAGLAPYEHIRRFVILPDSLSVRSGEVTHTQKLRRRQIEELHPDAVQALFQVTGPAAADGALDRGDSLG